MRPSTVCLRSLIPVAFTIVACFAALAQDAPPAGEGISDEARTAGLRAAWNRFPLVEVSETPEEPVTWYAAEVNTKPVVIDGKPFTGFRFRYSPKGSADFAWAFVPPGNANYWYIIPKTGKTRGFGGKDNGPNINSPFGTEAWTQGLRGQFLVPGDEYLMWIQLTNGKSSWFYFACVLRSLEAWQPMDEADEFTILEARSFNNASFEKAFDVREVGLAGIRFSATPTGLEVLDVVEKGPAAKLGVQVGDLITELDGKSAVNLTTDMALAALQGAPKSELKLTLLRNGQSLSGTLIRSSAKRVQLAKAAVNLKDMP